MMVTYNKLTKPVKVHLPDGSTKMVLYSGTTRVNNEITLYNVLYVQGFTHNLLSVAQLIEELGVRCTFYRTHCLIQRKDSDHVLGVGRVEKNLYMIQSTVENHFCNFFNPKEMTMEK